MPCAKLSNYPNIKYKSILRQQADLKINHRIYIFKSLKNDNIEIFYPLEIIGEIIANTGYFKYITMTWEFPGGSVVRTWSVRFCGPSQILGQGTELP